MQSPNRLFHDPAQQPFFTFFSQEIIKIPLKAYIRGFVVFQPISEGHFRLDFRLLGKNGKNRQFLLQRPIFSSNLTKSTEKNGKNPFFSHFEARRASKTSPHRFLTSAGQKSGFGLSEIWGVSGVSPEATPETLGGIVRISRKRGQRTT